MESSPKVEVWEVHVFAMVNQVEEGFISNFNIVDIDFVTFNAFKL